MTLDDEQARRLSALAEQLQTSPEDLARAAINDLVARHAGAFDAAAKFVLEKNHELYRRLS